MGHYSGQVLDMSSAIEGSSIGLGDLPSYDRHQNNTIHADHVGYEVRLHCFHSDGNVAELTALFAFI